MNIRILLADDHKIVRDGLRTLLEKETDMEVVAEAEDGKTAIRLARELAPNVIVMDIGMPGVDGIEATRQILSQNPGIKIIALSMHSDKRFIGGMLTSGASGYLLKDSAFGELAQAIRTIFSGQIYLSPKMARVVVEGYVRQVTPEKSRKAFGLTLREREVLKLLSEGRTTRDVAAMLQLSVGTIAKLRQQIMNKLDIHKATELVKYAIREGLIPIEKNSQKERTLSL